MEQGQAPTQVINTTQALFSTTTHPLCPWPQVAVYNGTGSTTTAASYTCRNP
ncbi:tannase/feruloyl esterase family alpha/beta hydrolase [Piscinibacter gummiphilus]|uniref:tannase/feruloyl esterase family alpha/beta hydrolase n=1 Tax=Piscinibacter gummiphilus TaxID=946333 RepID=UPI003D67115A